MTTRRNGNATTTCATHTSDATPGNTARVAGAPRYLLKLTGDQKAHLLACVADARYADAYNYVAVLARDRARVLRRNRLSSVADRTRLRDLRIWLEDAATLHTGHGPSDCVPVNHHNATGSDPIQRAADTLAQQALAQITNANGLPHDLPQRIQPQTGLHYHDSPRHRFLRLFPLLLGCSSPQARVQGGRIVQMLRLYNFSSTPLRALLDAGQDLRALAADWANSQPDNLNLTIELFHAHGVYRGRACHGSEGDDIYSGQTNRSNVFFANAGNDYLRSGRGHDHLFGGDGDDTFDAGAGNDTLHGGPGNNMYWFGRGDGCDVILSYADETPGKHSVVKFKAGVDPSQIRIERDRISLVFTIQDSPGDRLAVRAFAFESDAATDKHNPVQGVHFSNGTYWNLAELQRAAPPARPRDDHTINEPDTDHIQSSCAISEQRTHARSVGEAGYRDDHYWLARGDGQTRIVDTDDTPGNVDTLTLVQNIQLHNLWLTQVGQDLRLSVLGTRDDATIANWFQGAAYRVERIETSDKHVLQADQVDQLVQAMATMSVPSAGQTRWNDSQKSPLFAAIGGAR